LRISKQLTLALVVLATVPLFVAGSVSYLTAIRDARQFEQERLEDHAAQVAGTIDAFVAGSNRDIVAIAAGLSLALDLGRDASRFLTRANEIYPHYSDLMLVDADGTIHGSSVAGRTGKTLYEFFAELTPRVAQAQHASSGEVFISDLSEDLEEGEEGETDEPGAERAPDLELLTPVHDSRGRLRGMLVGVASTQRLVGLMHDIGDRLPGRGGIELRDRQDRVLLAGSDGDEVAAADGDDEPEQMTARTTLSEYGANRIGGWQLVVSAPVDAVMAPVHQMFATAAAVVLALLAAAAVIALWLGRSLSQPIVKLTQAAEALAAGNGAVRAEVAGSTEARQLATSFNNMANAIAAKTQALEAEIAERNRQAEQLREARSNAEAASRAKSDFLANMSHEIRTPMNGVLGFTNLLLDTRLDAEQREFVQTIRQSGEGLLHIINDILDFSKVEAGKLAIERHPFKLGQAAEEVAELLAPQAEKQGVELALAVAAGVPEYVDGDAGRVRQILLNLVGNAIKFTREGHVLIEIDCAPAADGESEACGASVVRCTVTDTGIGIAADKQSRLFHEFVQADTSTTREFGGTGLGLVIAKRLIELMSGRIGFTSEPGKGSRFWFTLPASTGLAAATVQVPESNLADMRVLVVDDYEINRRLVSEQLKTWGIAHECADSGREALEKLRTARASGKPFDVALLDFLMPGMDGLELGQRIKADPALESTALIMLTSGSQRSAAPSFMAAGFSVFMMKPVVRPLHLLDAITKAWYSRAEQGIETAPPAQGSAFATRAAATIKTAQIAHEASDSIRALVAEDNPVNQRLIKRVLEKLGCRVDLASNGQEAVAMAQALQYDIILMDCSMPEMDGYEATAELRRSLSQGQRLPIVALTAHAMPEDRAKCIAAGMDDYLSKPVDPALVRKVLDRWIERSHGGARQVTVSRP
jgi:signal transduction histidine kinase/DNA-binding response OmpR family regulator